MKDTDKVTLTLGQLKKLVKDLKEPEYDEEDELENGIIESSNNTFDFTDPDDLIDFIKTLPDADSYLFEDDGSWYITNEWLCGTFAGRSFEGYTPQEAAEKLIKYFNNHIGHNSIVGDCVTKSGWPNKQKVKEYVLNDSDEDIG